MEITQEILQDLFDYREDGNLIRKKSIGGNGNDAGKAIGCVPKSKTNKYVTTQIKGQHWCVHKLIYLYHHGHLPKQLDHINRNKLDNRVENLRPATSAQNASNRNLFKNNTSGCAGVSFKKETNKWFVYVNVNRKRKNIGYFDDLELAELVAIEARDKYHGTFARHN